MFVNTALSIVIDPALYPGRLVVCTRTEGRPECGVFSGNHDGFRDPEEMGKRQPTIHEDSWSDYGLEVFEIIRENEATENQVLRYHYAVIQWENGVYAKYPVGRELVLVNSYKDPWSISFAGVVLVLPDYGQL